MVEKKDYEEALNERIPALEEVINKISSARITEAFSRLKQLLEEELKEVVYKEYKATREVEA